MHNVPFQQNPLLLQILKDIASCSLQFLYELAAAISPCNATIIPLSDTSNKLYLEMASASLWISYSHSQKATSPFSFEEQCCCYNNFSANHNSVQVFVKNSQRLVATM